VVIDLDLDKDNNESGAGTEAAENGVGLNSRILALLDRSEKPMSINEIADALGVHRSTISRRMKALEKDSMVQKDSDRCYSVFCCDLPPF